ncbi:MAG: FlgD immunoglobulin-like domain containing protein [Candidatus Latescibacterota bacterium]
MADLQRDTWWQPEPTDPVEAWWLELDLGRAVAADRVRLIFPDTAGARRFTYFAVYVSPGFPINADGAIAYTRINRPGIRNTERVVEYPLSTVDRGGAQGEFLVTADTLDFALVRFVRFEAQAQPLGAALAEIEVETPGYNVLERMATDSRVQAGLEAWGGGVRSALAFGGAEVVADPSLSDGWWMGGTSGDNWRSRGAWMVLDLGSAFHLDRLLWIPLEYRNQFEYAYAWSQGCDHFGGMDFLTSTGVPDRRADASVEGPYRYDGLASVGHAWSWWGWGAQTYYDLRFAPRPVRYLLWHMREGFCAVLQAFAFQAEGYPAQVELESPDMDLGMAQDLTTVEWDASTPAGTRLEVETQTGNGYDEVTRYYLANGAEVTRAAWEGTKPRRQGPVVTSQVRDATWSGWSGPQRVSGGGFLSPKPRRWLRARVRLTSDDPDTFPVLRAVSFTAVDPLVANGVTGTIWPAEAPLDSLQGFVYTLLPGPAAPADLGFDLVRIELPWELGEVVLDSVQVGGLRVDGSLQIAGQALLVRLPPPAVRTDSVRLAFRTRLYRDPTFLAAFVLNSARPGQVQEVAPAWMGADQVYVPGIPAQAALLRNLVHDRVFTPNGDGANDEYRLSVVVTKTEQTPRVTVRRLDGRRVRELDSPRVAGGRVTFTWQGTDDAGVRVPPGLYLVSIRIGSDARDEATVRVVCVAY